MRGSGAAGKRLGRSVIAAVALALALANTTLGWSQLRNNFPGSPTSCDNSSTYPCVAWPLNSKGQSITVYVHLSSTLTTATGESLSTDSANSAAKWNLAAANNWGATYVYASSSNVHVIASSNVYFNSNVIWNHSYTYDCGDADSRNVATHELGHVNALGHTSYNAVMKQGGETFWTPQSNDILGLQAIYGAP